MRVSVLGTFEVTRSDTVMTPTAPKLRRVLALLSLQSGSVVPARQLVEELWNDRPPISSATTLQTYIYQLRKLLDLQDPESNGLLKDSPGAATLFTRSGGYLLRLLPEALDATCFERLAAEGREQIGRGDIVRGARTLHHALALWRGPALSDLDCGHILNAEATRLQELRGCTTELRIDADLNLGRHKQLVSELTALTLRDRTHEGLSGRLMLALYRSGRRTEALQVFKRARSALVEELGLEPGPELQILHRNILTGDPGLDLGDPVGRIVARQSAPTPAQLPPAAALVGRDTAVRQVVDRLLKPVVERGAVVVTGPPGVGVTGVCLAAAHRVRESFPDGQLWAQLEDRSREGPSRVLDDFLSSIGHPAANRVYSLVQRAALFRSWCADRRVLVVLDRLRDLDQLLAIMPSGPHCATLVGGLRRAAPGGDDAVIELGPLREADAMVLLCRLVDPDRLKAEPDNVHQLLDFCGGLPVALRAVADELVLRPHWRISSLLSRLVDPEHRAAWLNSCGAAPRRTVEDRLRLLPPAEREVILRLGGRLPRQVTIAECAAQTGADFSLASATLEACAELRMAEVVEHPDPHQRAGRAFRFAPVIMTAIASIGATGDTSEVGSRRS